MILRCPLNAQINALICIYTCTKSVKEVCKVYEQNYDKITKLLIEQKYLDKYGIPGHVLPKSRQPKKESKRKPKEDTATVKPAKETKPKTAKPAKDKEAVPAASVKPKRKRRTKAEMAFARNKKC